VPESNTRVRDPTIDRLPHIPEDLLEFIQRDTYSLLIKGFAGTGKTTLALTILNVLGVKNNFFYISTRSSPKQLFLYYPWLKEFVRRSNIHEGTLAQNQDVISTFEDARLDEPESLFERITNQLMDIKSPIIIIDSWDAIAAFMDKDARLNNERVLQTWRERAGAKLIFISEQPSDSTLDFLVDGIVELEQTRYHNEKVRLINLQKLRGTPIIRPSHIYTLYESIFHSYSQYRRNSFKPSRMETRQGYQFSVADKIQTGYPVLDELLGGGYPVRGVVLLELDSQVNMAMALLFLRKIVENFILSGNPVLLECGGNPRITRYSPMQLFEEPLPANSRKLFKISAPGKSQSSDQLLSNVIRMRQRYRNKTLLSIMSAVTIERLATVRNLKTQMLDRLASVISQTDLSVLVLPRSQENLLTLISAESDIYLQLTQISDTIFLRPLVPPANLHGLVFDSHSNIELKPLV